MMTLKRTIPLPAPVGSDHLHHSLPIQTNRYFTLHITNCEDVPADVSMCVQKHMLSQHIGRFFITAVKSAF
jgi:hypothetical protein